MNSTADIDKVGSRIIARDSGNWFHAFTKTKGLDDGLAIDMNVIAGGGLVGRITDIGSNWAKVNSIINDDSNVRWYGSCKLRYVNRKGPIAAYGRRMY